MEKLLRRKIIFKAVMISSIVLGVLGFFGSLVFSLLVMYLPLFISIVFLANALFGTVFYYIGSSNAAACARAIPKIEGGARKISEIAPAMCRTNEAAEALLAKCISRGDIVGFVISNGELCESIEDVSAKCILSDDTAEFAVSDGATAEVCEANTAVSEEANESEIFENGETAETDDVSEVGETVEPLELMEIVEAMECDESDSTAEDAEPIEKAESAENSEDSEEEL